MTLAHRQAWCFADRLERERGSEKESESERERERFKSLVYHTGT